MVPKWTNTLATGGAFKLIEHFDDGTLELYDLERDISESHNLAESKNSTAARLQGKLAEWRKDVQARMPIENPKFDIQRRAEWWSRRTNQRIDIERIRRRYQSRNN